MYQTGCNAYKQSAGNTVEDKRVVLLKLYDGALKFLAQARRGIVAESSKIRGENISKAMAIIEELNCALDMERGGELASQLDGLYRFAMDQLTKVTVQDDLQALDQAEGILITLKEGFEAAVREQKSAMPHTPQVGAGTEIAEGVRLAV